MPDNFKNPLDLAEQLTEQSKSPIEQWRNLISNHPRQKGSVSDWSKAYQSGAFNDPNVDTQIAAGWYDWWGPDRNLIKGTKTVGDIINKLTKGGKVDLDKNYVWFKENQPANGGNRYLDFRFSDLDKGDVNYTTQIGSPWNKKKYAVYGRDQKGEFQHENPLFESDDLDAVIQWFNSPWGQNAPEEVKQEAIQKVFNQKPPVVDYNPTKAKLREFGYSDEDIAKFKNEDLDVALDFFNRFNNPKPRK